MYLGFCGVIKPPAEYFKYVYRYVFFCNIINPMFTNLASGLEGNDVSPPFAAVTFEKMVEFA